MQKTFLVTGAAGFIASRTAEMLLEQGHTVVGLDNMNDYYDVRLKEYRLGKLKQDPNFIWKYLDIEDFNALKTLFQEYSFSVVFNLAARAGVRYSLKNPFVYNSTNSTGTLNLLELMKQNGVKKMVLASTSSLYAGLPMPFTEDLAVNTPLTPYAASKKAAEMMAYSYHKMHDLDISVVRYFTVFGPAGRPDMAPLRFVKWIAEGTPITLYGDGEQARDFTFVDDIARGTIAAGKEVGYEVINLGGGNNPVSINSFIAMIEEMTGKKAVIDRKPMHKADMKETWADISKAERLLDWKPQVSVEEGVKQTVGWYYANEEFVRDLKVI
ncbi:GDP-mannose 4,6-dehydratase [Saccharicrinis sp. FJH2]|uniref:GDP-mannose 4,6-dehydratase n=1 Tax=Saccharicrinis sp. FJH65 TaxID=3344659 RepID=UPI0035F3FFD2